MKYILFIYYNIKLNTDAQIREATPPPRHLGDINVQLRRRLPLALPLCALELVQSPIDLPAQVRFVAQQSIRRPSAWNDCGEPFEK
jgi:hypothetical protein